MLQKTIENLKNLKNPAILRETVVSELKQRTAGIVKITAAEREKILDTVVAQLLKGEELGEQADVIRAKVRARLFDKAEGDTLFLSNLKYINEVLTGSLPRSIAELTGFRATLAQKLVEDARGGTVPQRSAQRREGHEGGRRGDHRRGRQHDRPQHGQRQGQGAQGERGAGSSSARAEGGAHREAGRHHGNGQPHEARGQAPEGQSNQQRSHAPRHDEQRPQSEHAPAHSASSEHQQE